MGEYLRVLHAHIHRRWADNFLRLVGEKLPPVNPLNDAAMSAEVDLVVAADGQLISAKITRSSGFAGFDDAIVEVLRDAVPFPTPPPPVRSDDDKLHAHWVFARDQRRCAGVALTRAYDPLEVAIPKLLRTGRRDEALSRVAHGPRRRPARGADVHAAGAGLDQVRRSRAVGDRAAGEDARRARRRRGDQVAQDRRAPPRADRRRGRRAGVAQDAALPARRRWFESDNWTDHQTAAVALATSGDPGLRARPREAAGQRQGAPGGARAAATALGVDRRSRREEGAGRRHQGRDPRRCARPRCWR